jgi:hypothetical protein
MRGSCLSKNRQETTHDSMAHVRGRAGRFRVKEQEVHMQDTKKWWQGVSSKMMRSGGRGLAAK